MLKSILLDKPNWNYIELLKKYFQNQNLFKGNTVWFLAEDD